ncbi:Synaptic vesicle glycoprotein 2B [Pseudolycoriella hygida]|uniref:Synaptic vesicle glycoprotein 2B n=1 Tax=Pseudolycoriella hygida TaxID=35572 RepID=A0A9Q0N0B5_9DIPT|nr:Synaptic vesicle glycoprotein 2B [Pseudolycoriella hygida]
MCEFQEKSDENKNSSLKEKSNIETESSTRNYQPKLNLSKPTTPTILTFDEALALTKFGKFNYCLILVCGAILTTVLLETLGISFVLPVSECDMELSTQDKGILSAIGFAGIITSSHLWGFLADTTGRRRIILPALMLSFTFTVMSSLSRNFWTFVVLRFLSGFFVSGPSATVYAYLGEFHTVKHRSRAIMYASVIFGLTCISLPLMAWVVINQQWEFNVPFIDLVYKPWRLFLIVCGLPSFFCALALIKIPESPRFDLSQGRQSDAIATLQFIHRVNNGKNVEPLLLNGIIDDVDFTTANLKDSSGSSGKIRRVLHSMKVQTLPLFMAPYWKKTLIACAIQFGIFTSSNGMYMFFPLILNRMAEFADKNEPNRATICQILSATNVNITDTSSRNETLDCTTTLDVSTYEHSLVLELLYAVGFALIGLVINRLGKLPVLFVILVICGVSGLITVFINLPLIAIYLYLILLLCGLGVTVVNAATVDLYPTNLRAMAVCISLMMGRLGSVVGANIVGLLLDNHCELAFTLSGSTLIFSGVLAFFIPDIRSRTEKREISHASTAHRESISSIGR